jgi:uncharacterized membrane protein YeiH
MVFIALLHAGLAGSIASLLAMAAIFLTRIAAIHWHLTLPSFTARS